MSSVGASVIPGNDIELTTLDSIVEETGKIPGVIKMDIEGYEVKALRDFSHFKTLKGIVMEVIPQNFYKKCRKSYVKITLRLRT